MPTSAAACHHCGVEEWHYPPPPSHGLSERKEVHVEQFCCFYDGEMIPTLLHDQMLCRPCYEKLVRALADNGFRTEPITRYR